MIFFNSNHVKQNVLYLDISKEHVHTCSSILRLITASPRIQVGCIDRNGKILPKFIYHNKIILRAQLQLVFFKSLSARVQIIQHHFSKIYFGLFKQDKDVHHNSLCRWFICHQKTNMHCSKFIHSRRKPLRSILKLYMVIIELY